MTGIPTLTRTDPKNDYLVMTAPPADYDGLDHAAHRPRQLRGTPTATRLAYLMRKAFPRSGGLGVRRWSRC